MNNRRTVLKTMLGSALGFLGFTQAKEVVAEDLSVNSCSLRNSNGIVCFDIDDVMVCGPNINITTNNRLISEPSMSLISQMIYGPTPINGTVILTRDGLKQKIEFKNYAIRCYGLKYDGQQMYVNLSCVSIYGTKERVKKDEGLRNEGTSSTRI